jgi:hypothetical protein
MKKSGGSTLSYMIKRRYGWTCKIFCSMTVQSKVCRNKYNANLMGVTPSKEPSDTKIFGSQAKGYDYQSATHSPYFISNNIYVLCGFKLERLQLKKPLKKRVGFGSI